MECSKDPRLTNLSERIRTFAAQNKYMAIMAPIQSGLKTLLEQFAESEIGNENIITFDGASFQQYPRSLFHQMALHFLNKLSDLDTPSKSLYQGIFNSLVQDHAGIEAEILLFRNAVVKGLEVFGKSPLLLFREVHHLDIQKFDELLNEFRFWYGGMGPVKRDSLTVLIGGACDVEKISTGPTSPFNMAEKLYVESFSFGEIKDLFSDDGLNEEQLKKIYSVTDGFPLHVFNLKSFIKQLVWEENELIAFLISQDKNFFLHRMGEKLADDNFFELAFSIVRNNGKIARNSGMSEEVLRRAYLGSLIKKLEPEKDRIAIINPVVYTFLSKLFQTEPTFARYYQLSSYNLREQVRKEILNNRTTCELMLEDHAAIQKMRRRLETMDLGLTKSVSTQEFLGRIKELIKDLFPEISTYFIKYNLKSNAFDSLQDEENSFSVSIPDDEERLNNTFIRFTQIEGPTIFPKIHLEEITGKDIPDKLKDQINTYGIAVFPFNSGGEMTHEMWGLMLCTGPELYCVFPRLSVLFQKIKARFVHFFQKELLSDAITFISKGNWDSEGDFFKNYLGFIEKLIGSDPALLFRQDESGNYDRILPSEWRSCKLITCHMKKGLIPFACEKGPIVNMVHMDDHSFEKGECCAQFNNAMPNRSSLIIPHRDSTGLVRFVVVLIRPRVYKNGYPIFTKFHELLAELLGTYGGGVLELFEKKQDNAVFLNTIIHPLSQNVKKFSDQAGEILNKYSDDAQLGNMVANLQVQLKETQNSVMSCLKGLICDELLVTGKLSELVPKYFRDQNIPAISIETNIQNEKPVILSPGRVNIILGNVASNAVKELASFNHTKETPRISFETSVANDEKYLLLRYQDNLGGFPENILTDFGKKHIESSTGLGIGLNQCSRIMKKMKGRMEISNIKNGACINFYFLIAD